MSDATRARVRRVLDETGYAPRASAQAMRTGSSGVIGVVAGALTNPFYPRLVEALHTAISSRGRQMNLWIAEGGDPNDAGEGAALAAVRGGAVDGVIFTTATANSPVLRASLDRKAPIVLVNRTLDGLRCDRISTDNAAGARAVARYFAIHNRRRPAVIAGHASVSTSSEREAGFRQELARLGVPTVTRHTIDGEFSHEAGRESMMRLLEELERPDAVFCVNDVIAFGAIDAARETGVRIPDELWVVGFDDTELASWAGYSLTTVRQPVDDLAQGGVDLLLRRLADLETPSISRRLEAQLILRSSTANAAKA